MEVGSPWVQEGRVYFDSWDGNFYAIGAESGAEQWRFSTTGEDVSLATGKNDRVFLSDRGRGLLVALDAATGSQVWSLFLGSNLSAPTLDGTTLYVATIDGDLVAVDAGYGSELWRTPIGAASGNYSAPAISDGTAYVVSAEKEYVGQETLRAVNLNDLSP